MEKIILFYQFVPLADPEGIRLWQRTLSERYHLRGRIIVSPHGINGTLGGTLTDLKAYVRLTKQYAPFKRIAFKWSDGKGIDFPKLSVKVRDEIVTFGVPDEIEVNEEGIIGGGTHLKPQEVHELVNERGDDVIFFDGRNKHEAAIGKFQDAVVPNVSFTREFINELESGKYEELKDKPVITYCTGGVRCEVLSMLMKKRGFQEVYQMEGGIVRYGETYGDEGLWEGSLYVFDGRKATNFSNKAKTIGACVFCAAGTSNYENCQNVDCNRLQLVCKSCLEHSLCPACQSATERV